MTITLPIENPTWPRGDRHVVNAPATRIAYDNTTGATTWPTDWNELDMA